VGSVSVIDVDGTDRLSCPSAMLLKTDRVQRQ